MFSRKQFTIRQFISHGLLWWLALSPVVLAHNSGVVPGSAMRSAESRMLAQPIGTVESLRAVQINGQYRQEKTILWGGELIHVPSAVSANVFLPPVGHVILKGGSEVRVSTAQLFAPDMSFVLVLRIVLNRGDIAVKLQPQIRAQILAQDKLYLLSEGAAFRASIREGNAVLEADQGIVSAVQASAQSFRDEEGTLQYKIKPYNFAFSAGGYVDVQARSTRNLQIQVTDKDDKPVPDLLLLVLLYNRGGPNDVGYLGNKAMNLQIKTNANGIGEINFNASTFVGAEAQFEVRIKGNKQFLRGNIRIIKPQGFWTARNSLPLMAGVGVATAVTVASLRNPVQTLPPRLQFINGISVPVQTQ